MKKRLLVLSVFCFIYLASPLMANGVVRSAALGDRETTFDGELTVIIERSGAKIAVFLRSNRFDPITIDDYEVSPSSSRRCSQHFLEARIRGGQLYALCSLPPAIPGQQSIRVFVRWHPRAHVQPTPSPSPTIRA